jgi:hypothetical protein
VYTNIFCIGQKGTSSTSHETLMLQNCEKSFVNLDVKEKERFDFQKLGKSFVNLDVKEKERYVPLNQ